jgi:hypothetical protein
VSPFVNGGDRFQFEGQFSTGVPLPGRAGQEEDAKRDHTQNAQKMRFALGALLPISRREKIDIELEELFGRHA